MPDSFFDTNVLVYIASGDAKKADRVEATIAAGGAISVQVLNELTNSRTSRGARCRCPGTIRTPF
jgi:predicted nucleic acid-binding protein